MGIQTRPAYGALESDNITAVQHPVELDRNILKANYRQSGALRGGDWALTPTGVSQQLSIATGAGFVLGQESAQQGGYFAWSDAAELKTFGAPSGSPRIDTLLLRVYDSQYGTLPSGTYRAQWDIVAGTPGATPAVQPDSAFISTGGQWVPGAWMKWAEVRINPGDTVIPSGQIYLPGSVVSGTGTTWSQRYARLSGAPILCTSASRPASPAVGDLIYEIDTKRHNIWNGSAWYWPYARGRVGGARWTGTGNFGTGISTEATNGTLTLASFTPESNRAYKLKCRVQVLASAGGVNSAIRIRETNVSGTVRGETVYYLNSSLYGYKVDVEGEWDSGSSPAAVVWCITGQALAGGTISLTGTGANFPTYFDIIDEGPTGNQTINATP